MKIYDMHIHIYSGEKNFTPPYSDTLIANLEAAGIYGGCVFPNYPEPSHPTGTPFEKRLDELMAWVDGKVMDVLGIGERERELIYQDNLVRFLGIEK